MFDLVGFIYWLFWSFAGFMWLMLRVWFVGCEFVLFVWFRVGVVCYEVVLFVERVFVCCLSCLPDWLLLAWLQLVTLVAYV